MKRNQYLQAWAEFIAAVRSGGAVKSRLHLTLTSNLPPYLYKIWRWYLEQPNKEITSQDAATALGLSQNHVSFALKELWELGLLEREQQTDEAGQRFIYRYAEWEREQWRVE